MHEWTVRVTDASGNPVESAEVEIQGGMPEHDHGFPTQPQVTRNLGRGNYLVEGVKFNMGGWWEFTAVIRADGVEDKITFNILLDR